MDAKIKALFGVEENSNSGPDYFQLKGKKEQRAKLMKQAEAIVNQAKEKNRNLSAEEQRKFDKIHSEFNDLNKEIKKMEKQREGSISTNSQHTYWKDSEGKNIRVLGPHEKFSNSRPEIGLGEFVKAMVTGKGSPDVKNALSQGTDSAGGFTVPSATLSDFYDRFRAKSRVAGLSRSIQLDTDSTTIARVATDPVATFKEEAAESTPTDMTFQGVTFKPKTLRFIVLASRELIADSVNINDILETVFAGTTAAAVDAGILFGTNTGGEMKGLTSYDIAEVDMGENGAVLENYDPLIQAYRKMLDNNSVAPTGYLMAPREWETLATLKDTTNRYLDRPQALEGIPLLDTTNIPVDEEHGTAENASRIVTGNWNDLVIGLRSEMRIELLRERFASTYQYGFLCHMRVDALPAREESFAQITGIIPA